MIGFDSFLKLFDNNNFPDTLEYEKAFLYRECYSVSNGYISNDIFYTVCNETNFFVKHLKIKMNLEIPIFQVDKGHFPRENEDSYYL